MDWGDRKNIEARGLNKDISWKKWVRGIIHVIVIAWFFLVLVILQTAEIENKWPFNPWLTIFNGKNNCFKSNFLNLTKSWFSIFSISVQQYVHIMSIVTYQWIVTLYFAWFFTLTTRVSPLLTSSVGPGNIPFTVMMLWVLHSLFTGVAWTCLFQPIITHEFINCMVDIVIRETRRLTTKSWVWVSALVRENTRESTRTNQESQHCMALLFLLITSMTLAIELIWTLMLVVEVERW